MARTYLTKYSGRWNAARERQANTQAKHYGTKADPLTRALLDIAEEWETDADQDAIAADIGHTSMVVAGTRYYRHAEQWIDQDGNECRPPAVWRDRFGEQWEEGE